MKASKQISHKIGILTIVVGLAIYCIGSQLWDQWLASQKSGKFTICFESATSNEAQPEQIEKVRQIFDALPVKIPESSIIRKRREAIALHESGGDPSRISPTGCAGLLAISKIINGSKRCCESNEQGEIPRPYYWCQNERRTQRYSCDVNDWRFNPQSSILYALSSIESIDPPLSTYSPDAQLMGTGLFWNAGLFTLTKPLSEITTPEKAVQSIYFGKYEPYIYWDNLTLANKLAEIYDYLAFLQEHVTGDMHKNQSLCIAYSGSQEGGAITQPGLFQKTINSLTCAKVSLFRLSFGVYLQHDALFCQ